MERNATVMWLAPQRLACCNVLAFVIREAAAIDFGRCSPSAIRDAASAALLRLSVDDPQHPPADLLLVVSVPHGKNSNILTIRELVGEGRGYKGIVDETESLRKEVHRSLDGGGRHCGVAAGRAVRGGA